MKDILKLLFLGIFFLGNIGFGFAQQDFRLREWNADYYKYHKHKVMITTDGKLKAFPQYVFIEGFKKDQTSISAQTIANELCIELLGTNGKPITIDSWNTEERKKLDSARSYLNDLEKLTDDVKLAKANDYPSTLSNLTKDDATIVSVGKQLFTVRESDLDTACYCNKLVPVSKKDTATMKLCNNSSDKKLYLGDKGLVGYQITSESEWNKLMRDWMNEVRKKMEKPVDDIIDENNGYLKTSFDKDLATKIKDDESYKATWKQLRKEYDSLNKADAVPDDYTEIEIKPVLIEYLNSILDAESLDDQIKKSEQTLAEWKSKWEWVNNDLRLDPLMTSNPPQKVTEAYIKNLEDYYKVVTEYSTYCCDEESLNQWKKKSVEILDKINRLKKAKKNYDKYKAQSESRWKMILNKKNIIYSGHFYVSNKQDARFMRHHNNSARFETIGRGRNIYYDFEDIHYMLHNVPAGKTADDFELKASGEAISSHTPSWTEDISTALTGLSELTGLEKMTGAYEFIDGLKPFMGKNKPVDASRFEDLFNSHLDTSIANIGSKQIELAKLNAQLEWIKSLMKTKVSEEIVHGKTIELKENKNYKASAKVSYDISSLKKDLSADKTASFKDAYSYYKSKRFQIQAGLNFTPSRAPVLTVEQLDGNLSTKIEENPAQFTAMLKFYPWKSEIDDERISFHHRRLSIVGGLSIPEPLKNIYLGLGFDLFPGINLNTGVLFYQDNEYSITNGLITNTRTIYRPTWNAGIAVDASLFVKAIKVLF